MSTHHHVQHALLDVNRIRACNMSDTWCAPTRMADESAMLNDVLTGSRGKQISVADRIQIDAFRKIAGSSSARERVDCTKLLIV